MREPGGAMGERLRAVGLAGLVGVLLVLLSSCYLPTEFRSEIRINRYGDFALSYVGDLVYAPLYEQISQNRLSADEIAQKVDMLVRDLQRDKTYDPSGTQPPRPLFSQIDHKGMGRFAVRYQREGQLDADALVTFVRRNANILSLKSQHGAIHIRANALSATDSQQVMSLGLQMRGELRVVTDGQVLEHNANSVRPHLGYLVYIWRIDNALAPAPRLVMKQEARPGT